jgi:hypothetical protein
MLDDKMKKEQPERFEKIHNVAQKAFKKIDKNKAPLSLDMIKQATNLLPIQQKYAQAVFVEQNPSLKKDLTFEAKDVQDKSVIKSIARHNRKMDGKHHQDKNRPQNKPVYEGGEKIAMAHVKRIKQSAGTALTMAEIRERLPKPLHKYFEAVMRREHPEYFIERKKEEKRIQTIAKIRLQKKLYHQKLLKERLAQNSKVKKSKLIRNLELRDNLLITADFPKAKRTVKEKALKKAIVNQKKKSVA